MVKISSSLSELGFFCAFNTPEQVEKDSPKQKYVDRGEPNTYDFKNGVLAIYDEKGLPWIILQSYTEEIRVKIEELILSHSLRRGAYVPHSKDGGLFLVGLNILPVH
jgi:hypothetical protein